METKIPVVEDDPTLLDTLKYNRLRQQYQVLTVSDGVTGLEVARPDLAGSDAARTGSMPHPAAREAVLILMRIARSDEMGKLGWSQNISFTSSRRMV